MTLRVLRVPAVLLTTILFVLPLGSVSAQNASDTAHILFIGNSFTYYNNLPGVLEAIAESLDGPQIRTSAHVAGGYSLQRHLEEGLIPGLLEGGVAPGHPWDWVVLQEQSQLGTPYADPSNGTLGEPVAFHAATGELAGLVQGAESTPLLYMTWAKKRYPQQIGALAEAYDMIGEELGVPVAPVGVAWSRVVRERPELDLFSPDGSHPNSLGSYLAACVIYSVVTGMSAQGAPPTEGGPPWDDPGMESPEGAAILIPLSPETAAYLQRVAWETVVSRGSGDSG